MTLKVNINKQQGDFTIDVEMELPSKGVTALFGSSGSGKTTIVNIIAGLIRPDMGEVTMNGVVWCDTEIGIWVKPEKRKCGYVFQDGRLFPHMSVKGNLEYGMRLAPETRRYAMFDKVAEILGINHLLKRRPSGLSGGEKQRVAIGRALLTSPRLLLMDEPLASLDDQRRFETLTFISRLTQEFSIPIVYVSHSLMEIEKIADKVAHVDNGLVKWFGDISEFISMKNRGPELMVTLNKIA